MSPPSWARVLRGQQFAADRTRRLSRMLAAASLVMVVGPPLFVVAFFPLASAESLAISFNLPASIIQSDVLLRRAQESS
jgi:hypothetical protein